MVSSTKREIREPGKNRYIIGVNKVQGLQRTRYLRDTDEKGSAAWKGVFRFDFEESLWENNWIIFIKCIGIFKISSLCWKLWCNTLSNSFWTSRKIAAVFSFYINWTVMFTNWIATEFWLQRECCYCLNFNYLIYCIFKIIIKY